MAEVAVHLAIEKLGLALGRELCNQASSALFSRHLASLEALTNTMECIRRELHVMEGFLFHIRTGGSKNQTLEYWIEEVRKVAYIIEDIVDDYIYHVVHDQQQHGRLVGYMNSLLKPQQSPVGSLHHFASQLKNVENDLEKLSQLKDRWIRTTSFGHTSSSDNVSEWTQHFTRSSAVCVDEEELVGMDESRQLLTTWLRSEKSHLCNITVWSMGGLGKTTLVADVYKRESRNFDCHAWISISQTFKDGDLLRKMIIELFESEKKPVPTNIAAMDGRTLQETLRKFLRQRSI